MLFAALAACAPSSDDGMAQVTVSLGSPNAARYAARELLPSYVTGIDISVFNGKNDVIAHGTIPPTGGQLTLSIPPDVTLKLVGLALDASGATRFRGESTVPPMHSGAKQQVPLSLSALIPLNITDGVLPAGDLVVPSNSTQVAAITTTANADQTLTYTLSGADAQWFVINAAGVLQFAATPPAGTYAVTITVSDGFEEASRSLSVTVLPPSGSTPFTIGGAVSGLAPNSSVSLTLSGPDIVSETILLSNETPTYTLATALESGRAFTLTLGTPSLGQVCAFANTTASMNLTMGSAPITNANVTCKTPSSGNGFSVGGVINGLTANATGLLLWIMNSNEGNYAEIAVTAGQTTFTFPNTWKDGETFYVFADAGKTSPLHTCTVSANEVGSISGANVADVVVTCTVVPVNGISGAVSGLPANSNVALTISGFGITSETVTLSNLAPTYALATKLENGRLFTLALGAPTSGQLCTFANGMATVNRTMGSTAIVDADVKCFTPPTPKAVSISAGNDHTCMITPSGGVKCWGLNNQGQTGSTPTGTYTQIPTLMPNINGVVSLASAGRHTCALMSDGLVECWGFALNGQLGDGSTNSVGGPTPVVVKNLSGVIAITAKRDHSCALLKNWTLSCWGYGSSGETGNGTYGDQNTPQNVTGLSGVIDVAAGDNHTCALISNGTVKCWGNNYYGQLGDGGASTTAGSPVPVDAIGISDAVSIYAGGNKSCALLTTGELKCWGDSVKTATLLTTVASGTSVSLGGTFSCLLRGTIDASCVGSNLYGQLGDGTNNDSTTFVGVVGLGWITALTTGTNHACALMENGGVRCWGSDDLYKLGDGFQGPGHHSNVPVTALNMTNGPSLASGASHTCAISPSGSLQCWGLGTSGQLGNGATNTQSHPVGVSGLTNVLGIAPGNSHTCALLNDGTVSCWGSNTNWQLGNLVVASSSTPMSVPRLLYAIELTSGIDFSCIRDINHSVFCWGLTPTGLVPDPVRITGLTNPKSISAGGHHMCVVESDGTAKCWGANKSGQLGDGTQSDSSVPVTVKNLTDVVSIKASDDHTCALVRDGTVRCWGAVLPSASLSPVAVQNLSGVASIAVGASINCGAKFDGTAWCWGDAGSGTLGDGVTGKSAVPVQVAGASDIIEVSAGSGHACVRDTSSNVLCWGDNSQGQIGNGQSASTKTPVPAINLLGALRVATGGYDTCMLTQTSALKCFGNNTYGEFGDGTTTKRTYPYTVTPRSDYTQLAAGWDSACGLTNAGKVRCWGRNSYGELGNGNNTNSLVPVDVSGLTDVIAIGAHMYHVCALTASHTVFCWGYGGNGQLGHGAKTDSNIPVPVSGLTNAVAISVGNLSTCALLDTGAVTCWGDNASGNFGNATNTSTTSPVAAFIGITVTAIALGQSNLCAITGTGTVLCAGTNTDGELGDGSAMGTGSNTPVTVAGITNATGLVAGLHHECAFNAAGAAQCWGYGTSGQLGNGVTVTSSFPVKVKDYVHVASIDIGNEYTCAWTKESSMFCWGYGAYSLLGNPNYVANAGAPLGVPLN